MSPGKQLTLLFASMGSLFVFLLMQIGVEIIHPTYIPNLIAEIGLSACCFGINFYFGRKFAKSNGVW